MVHNFLYRRIQSLKLRVVSKPDESVIISGIFLAILFLVVALALNHSIWGDLAVNLSASMITVALTVLLVDKLRQRHIAVELNEPRNEAIRRIKISHNIMVLFLSIINFGKNSGLKAMVGNENQFFNERAHDNEVAKLVSLGSEVIKAFINSGTRDSLKQSSENISRELTNVRQNYDYAVDNDFRTSLNKMINSIEGLKGIWVVYDLDPATLQSFSDAGGDDFVRAQLYSYLETYNEFSTRYKIDDK